MQLTPKRPDFANLSKKIAAILEDRDLGVMSVKQVAKAFKLPQTPRLRRMLLRISEITVTIDRTALSQYRHAVRDVDGRIIFDPDACNYKYWEAVQLRCMDLDPKVLRIDHNSSWRAPSLMQTMALCVDSMHPDHKVRYGDQNLLSAMYGWELRELQLGSRTAAPPVQRRFTLDDILQALTSRSLKTLRRLSLANMDDAGVSYANGVPVFHKLEQVIFIDIGPLQPQSTALHWLAHVPSLISIDIRVEAWSPDDFLAVLNSCHTQVREIIWETSRTTLRNGSILSIPVYLQDIQKFVLIPLPWCVFPQIPSAVTWLELSEDKHNGYYQLLRSKEYGAGLTDVQHTWDLGGKEIYVFRDEQQAACRARGVRFHQVQI